MTEPSVEGSAAVAFAAPVPVGLDLHPTGTQVSAARQAMVAKVRISLQPFIQPRFDHS
jgi:hypothetical protein